MNLEKYRLLAILFKLDENELQQFIINYYDSFYFNNYVSPDYQSIDFNSMDLLVKLLHFFQKRIIDEELRKRIIISTPLIFSCEDFERDLSIIYKDSFVEGVSIRDRYGNVHAYRLTPNMRSILENSFLNSEVNITCDLKNQGILLKKAYYTDNDNNLGGRL